MRKLFILPIVGLMLFSCSKKELIELNGIIHGSIFDRNTGVTMDAVTISYRQGADSGSVVSDASGYFSIEGLKEGEVNLSYTKSGYAEYREVYYLSPLGEYEQVRGGGQVSVYEEANVEMVALGATINGVLLKSVGSESDVRPAANYTVYLRNDFYDGEGLLPAVYSTTTNNRGEFSFGNLPVNTSVTLVYPSTSDIDNLYEYETDYVTTPMSGSISINHTLYRNNLGIYLISSNLWATNGSFVQDFPISESITLTFNTNVSEQQTESLGYVSLSGVVLDYDSDLSYSGSTITINPPLDLINDATYTLDVLIFSEVPGDSYYESIEFHTAE